MDGANFRQRLKRRFMTGLTVSVAAHLAFAVLLGSAPKPAGSSGAPRIAVTITQASGGDASAKPWAIPDPPTPDLPVRNPKPEPKPVEVAKPVEPKMLREASAQPPERPPVIEVAEKAEPKKPEPVKPAPKPVVQRKPPRKSSLAKLKPKTPPVKQVAKKPPVKPRAAKKPAPSKAWKARKTAEKRQSAAAPDKAKRLAKSPVQSALKTEGDGEGKRSGADIPVMTTVRFASRPTPARYPSLSLQREEEGVVVVRALVSPDGFAGRVVVWKSSGFPRLDEAARQAVRKWHFRPARRGGRAIRAWVQVPVAFRIQ